MAARNLINIIFGNNKQAVTFFACVLIAAAIWTVNALSNTHLVRITIPLTYKNLSSSSESNGLPGETELLVKGRGFNLIQFSSACKEYSIIIDAMKMRGDDSLLNPLKALSPLLTKYEKDIEIIRISPEVISVSGNSRIYTKRVAVKAAVKISYRPSHTPTGPWVVYPDSITLASSAPIPDSIRWVKTASKEFKALDKSHFGSIALAAPQQGLKCIPDRAWIYIPLEKGTEMHLKVPISHRGSDGNDLLIPSVVHVDFQVPLSRYGETKASQFRLVADTAVDSQGHCLVRIEKAPYWADRIKIKPTTITRLRETR